MSDQTTDTLTQDTEEQAATSTAGAAEGTEETGAQAAAEPATEAEEPKAEAADATDAADAAPEAPTAETKAEEPAADEASAEGVEVEAEAAEAKAEEEPEKADAKAEESEKAEAKAEEPEKAEAKAEEPEKAEAKAEEPEKAEETEKAAVEAEAPEKAEAKAEEPQKTETKAEEGEGISPEVTMLRLEQAKAEKTPVAGKVIGWNKGGYHVAIDKVAAFCPVSQIEVGNPRSPKRYLDKTFNFQVIDIEEGGRRVVVSRAEAIKAEKEAKAALVREHLKPGSVVDGKVSSLTDFGAFVDLGGGIEGLVHVSEISRRRVEHPKEALQKGQEVKVSVLKIEKGGERISLSMKRLEEDPWKGVADRYPPGTKFTGTILRKADFGMFVEVEPGLEGLVHTSRLPLGKGLSDDSLEIGKEIEGWIHDVEPKRRRLSLSLREVAQGNPWKGVTDRYPVGEVTKGRVERVVNFGVFIELEPGLTGLLPASLLGGGAGNPRRQYHPGKEVQVRVLSIDRDKRRISLGTESSQAEGSIQDYKEYMKSQKKSTGGGLTSLAAAFEKVKDQLEAGG
jgi:small subunit ribosomal protein S1